MQVKDRYDVECEVEGFGSIARAHIDESSKKIEKAERVPNIHDAMQSKRYL